MLSIIIISKTLNRFIDFDFTSIASGLYMPYIDIYTDFIVLDIRIQLLSTQFFQLKKKYKMRRKIRDNEV